jgi:hypothetical protein
MPASSLNEGCWFPNFEIAARNTGFRRPRRVAKSTFCKMLNIAQTDRRPGLWPPKSRPRGGNLGAQGLARRGTARIGVACGWMPFDGKTFQESGKIWSEWQDLNLRPPAPEAGALPGCATLRPSRLTYIDASPEGRNKRPDGRLPALSPPLPLPWLAGRRASANILVCAGQYVRARGDIWASTVGPIIDSGMGRGQAVRQRVLVP